MSKESSTWRSERLGNKEVKVVRWGESGVPVLIFPTAAGDCEETERFKMIHVLAPLLSEGRIKVYSVDSVGGQAMLDNDLPRHEAARMQNRFDAFVYNEVIPAIRVDCRDNAVEVIAAGASIGAFNALAAVCRHPDVFRAGICMSGTYDLKKFMGEDMTLDYYYSSPLHFLPNLGEGQHLDALRKRFLLLTHGKGNFEAPEESWRVAHVLGSKNIPNRVDEWGAEWHHDWPTWRDMLPKYLNELLRPVPG
ncbi:MAG: alpha/beta hydrolase-fold protein [Planctomycetota bacterium]|nr:alpha/beta hydrolase-fold protein [Planctomycetota bacterium]